MKAKAHTVYEVERVIKAGEGRGALQRAVDGPGLESEQVLRLTIEGGRSVDDDARVSRRVRGGAGAGAAAGLRRRERVFRGRGRARVRLGLDNVAAMAKLRDDILSEAEPTPLPGQRQRCPYQYCKAYLKPSTPRAHSSSRRLPVSVNSYLMKLIRRSSSH